MTISDMNIVFSKVHIVVIWSFHLLMGAWHNPQHPRKIRDLGEFSNTWACGDSHKTCTRVTHAHIHRRHGSARRTVAHIYHGAAQTPVEDTLISSVCDVVVESKAGRTTWKCRNKHKHSITVRIHEKYLYMIEGALGPFNVLHPTLTKKKESF